MILNRLLPSACILCNTTTNRELELCTNCENDLPKIKNHCIYCASPLPCEQTICGSCLKITHYHNTTIAPFYYQKPITNMIINLKFNHQLIYAKVLGILLAKKISLYYQAHEPPETIIPVPLHPTKLKERGYNQALELAYPIAKKLNLSIDKTSVARTKNTLPQLTLTITKRTQNVKNAFNIKKSLRYKHVAIIDDVITTGNTTREICKTLKHHGVSKIDVWICAKAPYNI